MDGAQCDFPKTPLASTALLDRLFPLNIRIDASSKIITGFGPTIEKILPIDAVGAAFCDCFEICRPRVTFDQILLPEYESTLIVLEAIATGANLRGQFIASAPQQITFYGTVNVADASTLDELGLNFADFAVHDCGPDMSILHRVREMQVTDLEHQATELRAAMNDRDRHSERAATDPLTGLANRRAFWERGSVVLSNQKETGELTVLVIDLDCFKRINDDHGHHAGDAVLCEFSKRLRRAIPQGNLIARIGGDEFAVLMTSVDVDAALNRLEITQSEPALVEENLFSLSASIGAATVALEQSVDEALRNADIAMYAGRRTGPGQTTWFSEQMRRVLEEQKSLTQELAHALDSGGIVCALQPIVRLADGEVVAFEALARWQHPYRGLLAPDKFLDIAQNARLMPKLDNVIMRSALAHLSDLHAAGHLVRLQVNVCGLSIQPGLVNLVSDALSTYAIAPEYLTIEITETWIMQNEPEVANVLHGLANLGVTLHLDDFGTGYSSLTHLQAFPISGLKIDRTFVWQAMSSSRSRKLIEATMAIAKSLDLEVIAEGIETGEQARLVAQLGCHFGQGYLYARPIACDRVLRMLNRGFGARQGLSASRDSVDEAVDAIEVPSEIQ